MQKKFNIELILEIEELLDILETEKISTTRAKLCKAQVLNNRRKSNEEAAQMLIGYLSVKGLSEELKTKIYKILLGLTSDDKSNAELCSLIWEVIRKILGIKERDT